MLPTALKVAVPLEGWVHPMTVGVSPSGSLSFNSSQLADMIEVVSSAMVSESSPATGGSFTGVTVIISEARSVAPLPSLTS